MTTNLRARGALAKFMTDTDRVRIYTLLAMTLRVGDSPAVAMTSLRDGLRQHRSSPGLQTILDDLIGKLAQAQGVLNPTRALQDVITSRLPYENAYLEIAARQGLHLATLQERVAVADLLEGAAAVLMGESAERRARIEGDDA